MQTFFSIQAIQEMITQENIILPFFYEKKILLCWTLCHSYMYFNGNLLLNSQEIVLVTVGGNLTNELQMTEWQMIN